MVVFKGFGIVYSAFIPFGQAILVAGGWVVKVRFLCSFLITQSLSLLNLVFYFFRQHL